MNSIKQKEKISDKSTLNNMKLLKKLSESLNSNIVLELLTKGEINETPKKEIPEENKKIISGHPPDIIFVYSARSAESFIEIVKNYSLYPLMTGSKVMCISKKVADIFTINNWKKVKIFNPGDELLQLEEKN